MDYNKEEIEKVLKNLGLTPDEIKKANTAHDIAAKIDDKLKLVANATQQTGGASNKNTVGIEKLEQGLQKTFGFDPASMKEIDRLLKQNGGGGDNVKLLKGLQETFDFDAQSMELIKEQLKKKKGGGEEEDEAAAAAAAAAAANAEKFVKGSLKTIQKMLEENIVNINVQDRRGRGDTALIWHTRRGNANVVDYLLKKKAKVNIRNDEGQTAMDVAIQVEKKKCIQLLSNRFDIGDKIDGNIDNKGKWIPGTIVEVHGDGTFDIKYKDLRDRKGVQGKDIRISAEEVSGQSNFQTYGRFATSYALYNYGKTGLLATMGLASGGTMAFVVGLGFTILSDNLFRILDNFVDKQIVDETILAPICKAITYICPTIVLGLFLKFITGDFFGLIGTVMGGDAGFDNLKDSLGPDAITVNTLLGPITNLFKMAYMFTTGHPYITGGIVLTSLMVSWIVKTYMWTRFKGSKEDNEKLDQAIYSNHLRREMILKQHMKKMKKEQKSKELQREEYHMKLQEQIKLEDEMSQKTQEGTKNSEDKPGYKWFKFVPGRLPDLDERYIRGRTAKTRSKSKSKTKTSSSSRKRRQSSKENQG